MCAAPSRSSEVPCACGGNCAQIDVYMTGGARHGAPEPEAVTVAAATTMVIADSDLDHSDVEEVEVNPSTGPARANPKVGATVPPCFGGGLKLYAPVL